MCTFNYMDKMYIYYDLQKIINSKTNHSLFQNLTFHFRTLSSTQMLMQSYFITLEGYSSSSHHQILCFKITLLIHLWSFHGCLGIPLNANEHFGLTNFQQNIHFEKLVEKLQLFHCNIYSNFA